MSDLGKLNFGAVSAEAERSENPVLISEGFVDLNKAEELALNGKYFLFLGYKGSGKSSIGERIDLLKSTEFDKFVTKISLADFPYTPFSKIIKGPTEPEAKFPTAWSWILLVYVLESFEKDKSTKHRDMQIFAEAIKAFRDLGISPGSTPSSIVRRASKNTFTIKTPYNLASYVAGKADLKSADEIYNFVDAIKSLVKEIRSDSRHYLIIDGLDEILTTRGAQYISLYALINEVSSLNSMFSQASVPFKIILLCRTDLFDKTPGPNKNKIRQTHAVELDWYHDPSAPEQSLLMQAAKLRARLSLGRDTDLLSEFFPSYVYNTPVGQYLLDMTRHTPRDFFQLLNYVVRTGVGPRLTEDNVKAGLRDYSIKYFYPEIHDELSGYADVDEISHIIEAVGRVGKRDLSFEELLTETQIEYSKMTEDRLREICSTLFNCSAIGNIDYIGDKTHYSFKYRNRLSTFSKAKKIMLHRGLWKAVNIT